MTGIEQRSGKPWPTSHLLRAFALFLGLWVALRFLWMARSILLVAILGALFGIALSAGVDVLERFRIKRAIGTLVILALVFSALAGIGFLIAPALQRQSRELIERFPQAIERIEGQLRRTPLSSAALAASQPKQPQTARAAPPTLRGALRTHMQTFANMLFPFLANSVAAIFGVIVVIFLAAYIAADPGLYRGGMLALVPPNRRPEAEELFDELRDLLRQWLVARIAAMIVIGLVTAGALALLGIPAAGALGAIAGILEFVPFAGPFVSAIPAIAMALIVSPAKALYVVILFVALQQLEGNLLTPLLMKNRLDVPPVITILAVSALGMVFGILGMLIAEPASATVILMVRKLYVERLEERTETR